MKSFIGGLYFSKRELHIALQGGISDALSVQKTLKALCVKRNYNKKRIMRNEHLYICTVVTQLKTKRILQTFLFKNRFRKTIYMIQI